MSMLRSMDSAVSGLRNHQVRMDIIGNNIANINTVGFKSGRVTFEESLSQLLQGPTRPPGGQGGTNPIQVGLGMSVGSVDMKFTQGNLEATGQVTDLAIEGDSFFAVNSGTGNFYTRNGAFQLDANGKMVLPTNGFVLQGKMADLEGKFPAGTVISDITIPLNEQTPAKATDVVKVGKNLDSDSQAIGTVHYSQSFLHHAEGLDSLLTVRDSNGISLGIEEGDVLTFTVNDAGTGATTSNTAPFVVGSPGAETIDELMAAIQTFLGSEANYSGQLVRTWVPGTDPLNRGAVSMRANEAISNFQITSDNPLSTGAVTKSFAVQSTIPAGAALYSVPTLTDYLRSPAVGTDALVDIYDQEGTDLGLQGDGGVLDPNSDTITISGEIGGEAADNLLTDIVFDDGTGVAATTLNDILGAVSDNFRLPVLDGTLANNNSVDINIDPTDNIPDGSIVVRGMPGTDFALDNISIRAKNNNNQNPAPTNFNRNFNFTSMQESRDPAVADTSITVFDESGDDHIMTMTFVPTQQPGTWQWDVTTTGDEIILGGNSGELIFDQDGTVSSFTFNDDAVEFSFDPNNGSSNVNLKLDVGGPGDFRGLTQFRSPTTATITGQDGFTTGALREISINDEGVISGLFTNGLNKALAQVMLVDFINPGGLMKVSDSVFAESANSGDPVFTPAGDNQSSNLKPGALEISNVELAAEFTEMITTQRGYQANARGITVSDSMLEELVNLKR